MIVALIRFELRATQVSGGQKEGRMEGRMDGQGQTYIPPRLSEWGHKNQYLT